MWPPRPPTVMPSPPSRPRSAEAERLTGTSLLADVTDATTGEIHPIRLVSDNGAAFRAIRFATFLSGREELTHVRTRKNAPHTNGVRERGFGSLKYEHLYRHDIPDGQTLAAETETYREIFTWIRPHESLDMARPIDLYLPDNDKPDSTITDPNIDKPELLPTLTRNISA